MKKMTVIKKNRSLLTIAMLLGLAIGNYVGASEQKESGYSDYVQSLEEVREEARKRLNFSQLKLSQIHEKMRKFREQLDRIIVINGGLSNKSDEDKEFGQRLLNNAQEQYDSINKQYKDQANVVDDNSRRLDLMRNYYDQSYQR